MSRFDDFMAKVAKARLVLPHDLARARTSLPNESASDAARRLANQLVRPGVADLVPGPQGARRGDPWLLPRQLSHLAPPRRRGMGKVFLAAHETDGQRVAIKVLPPKKALEEGQTLPRFRREMELSQRVQHPNLARTLGVGQEGDIHFMIMEYIPGENLYEAVKAGRGGPLRVPDTARFFLKVLDGLEAAHNAGLVHRDIKPSNIMITPEGDARILDLGLARAMGEVSPLTRPNVVIGTLDYASPEQLCDAAKADRCSDLYSLGCTLYFTLSGRAPFEGGDVVNKIFKQRMDEPEPLERVARGVPAAFAAIVRKLMAKNPTDRYQTDAELWADLACWTDPEKVWSILGAEAEAAHVFQPPPPELADDDLHLLDYDGTTTSGLSLRDLGNAEPAAAPMPKMPPKPVPALVLLPGEKREPATSLSPRGDQCDDLRWLFHFIAIAVFLGVLAVLAITLLQW
jgi:serine/threonine protein kinase